MIELDDVPGFWKCSCFAYLIGTPSSASLFEQLVGILLDMDGVTE